MGLSLQEMTNRVLVLLDEPGPNPGGPPTIPSGALFNQFLLTQFFNEGIAAFISEAEYAPAIMDKLLTTPVLAGQDFPLPADLAALQRVEYLQGGVAPPMLIPVMGFDEFDVYSGGAWTSTGNPQVARVPFAGAMRFWPQPTATNVTAGDQVILYYSTYGTTLLNLTDVANLPAEFQEAPIAYALSRGLQRKRAMADAQLWEQRFLAICRRAKRRVFANDEAGDMVIGDAESPTTNDLYWR